VLCAAIALDRPALAQRDPAPGGVYDLTVPDGVEQVLGANGEAPGALRGHALADFIRRSYHSPFGGTPALDAAPGIQLDGSNGSASTLPLPLPPALWTDVVFGGRETPDTLLPAILRSRGPALFYYGLLSLDDDTRAWLATQPDLVAELAGRRAAAFVVAAPGLRVRGRAVDVPGGEAAAPAWRALVGHRPGDAAGFIRALLAQDRGRLAFFFGTMAQLTPGQLRVALRLDAPDPAIRADAARRLRSVFERVTRDWRVHDSVFSRPSLDPALLIASLRHDGDGMPVVPGTYRLWTAVFADGHRSGARRVAPMAADAEPVDFVWLCEQIFAGRAEDHRGRYDQVLFASRLEARGAHGPDPVTIDAVRAVRTFPALVHSLERARLADVTAFAASAHRAERIAAIRDPHAATRTLAQFQGALALVTRAASRGGMQPEALATAIASLSRVELSEAGEYEGRLVRWLDEWLAAHRRHAPAAALDVATAGPMERDALAALAGPADPEPRFVDWEGTRYRLDFAAAEGLRLARLLGRHPRPFLSSARGLVEIAEAIGRDGMPAEGPRQHAVTLEAIARSVGWDAANGGEGTDVPRRYAEARAALARPAAAAGVVVPLLLELADTLAARGLMELAYAVALGHPDRPAISADEAARRHAFAREFPWRRPVVWEFPVRGNSPERGWHVTGSLLGLDVQLADLGLVRLSMKPPARKPTVPDDQRRVLTEAVALVDAASLADEGQAAIVAAIGRGRARLAAARTPDDALALAEEIRMSPVRRTLWSWAIARDREDARAFLAPSELFWLGLDRAPVPDGLHGWGAPAGPRTGCLCLEVLDRQPWEALAGRRFSGALTSGFPDLNLRLAELLDGLRMPASLLAPVLAAATLDLIESAAARDPDDRQALLDFVHALHAERVEQYLALLTTDGPLVPVAALDDTGAAR
jgi:hypothetical protein